jgi:hypothetical protein
MTLETASLERLARALAETYYALSEVIQDLQSPPYTRNSFGLEKANAANSDEIIRNTAKVAMNCRVAAMLASVAPTV